MKARSYRDIDWPRLRSRYASWWRGELDTPLFYIATQPHVALEPRPQEHEAVKRWFMDPETRISREVALNRGRWFYADGFPTIDIGRINIGQAAFCGCPAHFANETIWLDPLLDSWDGWEEKIRFDPANELWRMTVAQAHLAVEMSAGEMAITTLGGFEGVLDNLATVRGVENALTDVLDHPEHVLALERRFLDDFRTIYFTLHDIIKDNPCGITTWNRALMTEGPVHCMQSDFSCMVSPRAFRRLGKWYLEEQASLFANVLYHLDGTNALQHLPMLCEITKLDGIQVVYQVPHGKRITGLMDSWRQIAAADKRIELWAQNPQELADVLPFLEMRPPKGIKLNLFPQDRETADALVDGIARLGYPLE
jgi:5-methyltetrahydrofolate--homocysteine methyltransferase